NRQIFVTVVVEVGKQCRPAPLRLVYTRQVAYFTKSRLLTHVEVQHVANVLVLVAKLLVVDVGEVALVVDHRLLPLVRFGKHIERHKIDPSVIVEFSCIVSHRELTLVRDASRTFIGKGSVSVIDVEYIVGHKVVADIYIRPAIRIEVGNSQSKTKSFIHDASLDGHIGKRSITIVSVEPVVAGR